MVKTTSMVWDVGMQDLQKVVVGHCPPLSYKVKIPDKRGFISFLCYSSPSIGAFLVFNTSKCSYTRLTLRARTGLGN